MTGGSASGGSGSQSGPPSRSGGHAQIFRLRSSRQWISAQGPKANRRTTLTFRLAQGGRVVFTVMQVSPVCRLAGTFTVRGHPGLNKVPFKGRLRGRQLPSGTYRISARTRGGTVLRVTVVIVESGAPSPTELETAKRSNVCGARAALASSLLSGVPAGPAPERAKKTATTSGSNHTGGVASASSTHSSPFSPARVSEKVTDPLVIAVLAAAILLLGLAALPGAAIPDPRLSEALAQYRLEIATAGATALGAAIGVLVFA